MGHRKGSRQFCSPNDHVFGQSTNDVYPTAFRLALILRLSTWTRCGICRTLSRSPAIRQGAENGAHLQDAVPMSLGQEFGWGTTIGEEVTVPGGVRQFLRDQPWRDGDWHDGDRRKCIRNSRPNICPNSPARRSFWRET
jgi:aspartate ammonia-lyase